MQRILFAVLVISTFLLGACQSNQTLKDSWKFTQRQYRSYLNTPASLDMEDTGSCELYELALGDAVLHVDAELQRLLRTMENSDHNPDEAWVMRMMGNFAWISGVALVDNTGAIVARYPEHFAKEFSVAPLLEPDPKQRMGALRAYVQQSEQGPEVYVGNPVYTSDDLKGLIVVHFDPRALATMSSDPGSFIIASPAGVVWPGAYGTGGVVGSQDWEEILRKKSCGLVGDSGSEFFWTTRYLGNLPLVYAMPTSAGQQFAPEEAPATRPAAAPAAVPLAPEGQRDAQADEQTTAQQEVGPPAQQAASTTE